MHEEWFPAHGSATSWNTRRLLASAVLLTVGALIVGLGAARLLRPGSVAAGPPPAVASAVEDPPATELGDAVAAERAGPFVPAPSGHLAVVQMSVNVCDARSVGSGVVVADGLLLTAAHVVGDATLVRVDQGGVTVTGEVLGVLADDRDLALVAVDAPMGAPLSPGRIGPLGEPLTLVGHPDGGPRTSLVGARVDVAPAVANLAGGGEILGVDVSITAGISGGPALDASGAMVGVVVAREAATDTALVVATPDLAALADAALVPGRCRGSA